jgi:hypothetical protein
VTRTVGYLNIPGAGRLKTEEIVARIRRFRGRLRFTDIVRELGWPPGRISWLKVRQLCIRFEIATNDADDPDYYTSAIRDDERKLREADRRMLPPDVQAALDRAAERAKAELRTEIGAVHRERTTARPLDKGQPLEWPRATRTRFSTREPPCG